MSYFGPIRKPDPTIALKRQIARLTVRAAQQKTHDPFEAARTPWVRPVALADENPPEEEE